MSYPVESPAGLAEIIGIEAADLQKAADLLAQGGLAALPTETVYGLAADATNGTAVARIFEAKGRPHFNPLIAHVSSIAMAERYVVFDDVSRRLAEQFWPGPLTLVLPLRTGTNIHPLVTTGLPTLAVRMPCGPVKQIIKLLDRPLAAPSANRSGRISPTSAIAVADDLGDRLDLILDGGACKVGLESTIVKVSTELQGTEPQGIKQQGTASQDNENPVMYLLRPGGLAAEEIEAFTGQILERIDQREAIQAPGMLASHYAPKAQMRLNVAEVYSGEALLSFGTERADHANKAVIQLNLSPDGDLREAAVRLFDYMKQLDQDEISMIAVEPVPHSGLGEAINDRLARAAAPRD